MPDLVTLLERLPDGVRARAYRIAEGRGWLGRAADALRYRFSADDIPQLPEPSDASVRLLIGPANSAGQAYEWARAVERRLPSASAMAMHGLGDDPFSARSDIRVPVAVYQRSASWHLAWQRFLVTCTHVIWESGLPLLGRRMGSDTRAEITWATQHGVRAGLMFHGSDIRPPSGHAAQSAWSPFREPAGPIRALEERTRRNAELAASAGVPVFVSTPDLLDWVPGATWMPVVVDASVWTASRPALSGSRPPVVVHAPTHRWIKGTDLIEPMLRRLSDEGVIEYRQVMNIPHARMPEFYGAADIVLDQFRLGSYGVAACEALAAGRLVMGHVDDETRARVRATTGRELPIREATIDSLEAELRRAATNPEEFEEFRSSGPAFVEAVHDGRRSAAVLADQFGISA